MPSTTALKPTISSQTCSQAGDRAHVIAWRSEVFDGPTKYTDELGGYERMLAKHHDLAITTEQRFRFAF